jgi:hypothetical protein
LTTSVIFVRRTEEVCSQLIEPGSCGLEDEKNATDLTAVWGYSGVVRRCVPFYYSGCQARRLLVTYRLNLVEYGLPGVRVFSCPEPHDN